MEQFENKRSTLDTSPKHEHSPEIIPGHVREAFEREADAVLTTIDEARATEAGAKNLEDVKRQQEESADVLARIDAGETSGIGEWLEKHARFGKVARAFALASGVASAGAGGYFYGTLYKQPTVMERALTAKDIDQLAHALEQQKIAQAQEVIAWHKAMLEMPKEQMQTVQGTELTTNMIQALAKGEKVEGLDTVAWARQPNVPPMPDVWAKPRIVEVRWNFVEKACEIAPGKIYKDCWTIEGDVPGPIIRLVEGDVLRIMLTNPADSTMPHNLDFHAVTGPGGGGEDLLVAPGETKTIEARLLAPGFYQYHCAPVQVGGAAMLLQHVANGMSGAVLVQPREYLDPQNPRKIPHYEINKPVDHEWYVAQNEWYAKQVTERGKVMDKNGKEKEIEVAVKDASGKLIYELDEKALEMRHPSHIVFNGAVGSLSKERALQAKVGETARLYMLDSGPNNVSNFHVIGEIFDKVYRDGDVISEPDKSIGTTLVPSGGTSIVEMKFSVPEDAKIVTHDLGSVNQGAIGVIHVTGPEQPAIYQPINKE